MGGEKIRDAFQYCHSKLMASLRRRSTTNAPHCRQLSPGKSSLPIMRAWSDLPGDSTKNSALTAEDKARNLGRTHTFALGVCNQRQEEEMR